MKFCGYKGYVKGWMVMVDGSGGGGGGVAGCLVCV